ncbi:hypothetical protein [Treponema bryantii]|uniref:hypothetical protein n=1 Tax=Treponema bryantii TaxID=163 RepID=UPI002B2A6ED6|nr:hypothetical protein TRBR_13730 [Treponema bryantii]
MKKIVFIFLVSLLTFSLFAKSGNSTQIIKSGHWVYDDLEALCMESKTELFFETQPMSIGEMKFYFKRIPYEKLSDSGKVLYEKVKAFLNKNDDFFPELELRLFGNIKVNPEFYYKSNKDVNWSFNYYFRDFFITIPLIIGFSDYVTIEPDFMIGKNQPSIAKSDNFTNIVYAGDQFEFTFPRFAYGSAGHAFDKWGIDFSIAKEGLQIYNTQLGSILYNRTFETDMYCSLRLYTEYLKYTLHVAEVDNTKFLYLHQVDLRPFKWLKVNVLEGSLLNAPFELRYLNPFILMHQFGSWEQYGHLLTENEHKYYGEGHFCAYFGLMFEIIPFKNFKIYGMYAQNEILDMGGSRSDRSLSVPDSIGGQLGFQYDINLPEKGIIKTHLEGVYTSPYLYIKQSPDWSLYRLRDNMQTSGDTSSWIGSPFGPDCFAVTLNAEYDSQEKWKAGIGYIFSIHGENTAESLFSQKTNVGTVEEPEEIYSYYPYVQYKLADDDENRIKARDKGRYMWMTGEKTYKHQIKLSGSYSFLDNLSVYGQTVYTIQIFNNEINHAIEIACGLEYQLFK